MSRRSSSLKSLGVAVSREIGSSYDFVKDVSEYLNEIEFLSGQDLFNINSKLNLIDISELNNASENATIAVNARNEAEQFALSIGPDATFDSVQLLGGTGEQGKLSWNVDEETLDLVTDGSALQLGQEVVINVINNTGSLITNGTPLVFTGTVGNSGKITVAPANGSTMEAEQLVGIATVDIPANGTGKATHFGKVRGINTTGVTNGETWNDGDVLYIDPVNVGKLTNVKPSADELLIPVAVVVHAHNNGSLVVRVTPENKNYISDAITTNYYSKSQLDSGQLDNRYYTETEVDNLLAGQNEASEISYSNISSGLVAANVQNAVDELQADLNTKAAELQTSSTSTSYTDATTAVSYKLYIDNGDIILEEL